MWIVPERDQTTDRGAIGKLVRCGLLGMWMALSPTIRVMAQDEVDPEVQIQRAENLIKALESDRPDVRLSAAVFMANLAPKARDRFKLESPIILAKLREAGPKLANLAQDSDPRIRAAALAAMGWTQSEGSVAARAWEIGLDDQDLQVRVTAARAVGLYMRRVSEESRISRSAFVEGLSEEALDIRMLEDATSFPTVLRRAALASEPEIRRIGLESLNLLLGGTIRRFEGNPTIGSDMGILPSSMEQGASEPKRAALIPFAQELVTVIPALIENLGYPDPVAQAWAAQALESMARLSRPSGDPQQRGNWRNPSLGEEGKAAATKLFEDVKQTLPSLQSLVQREAEPKPAIAGLNALGALGQAGESAVPDVVAALDHPDLFVRWSAVLVLREIAPIGNELAVEGLAMRLFDADLDVRLAACQTLELYGPIAAKAVPAIAEAIVRDDNELQLQAMKAIEAIGPEAAPAVPALIEALRSYESRVRREAAFQLGKLGREARSAASALEQLFDDPDVEVRQNAGEAILRILE